ncbi:hypothetical protein B0H14DRAFT_2599175 [Mycena olivaceomarginata]|nr:hypothetical protein B0H14DRAFT_2599175 [Mycena olivaceomarginata]
MTSASYASITGLTVLENPRKTSAKGLVFDGFFYLGTESRESIMASLRYFNANGTDFPPVGVYFLYATTRSGMFNANTKIMLWSGMFQFLHLIGTPDEVDFDMHQRAYVHLAGAAMNPNTDTATWSMEADQYTAAIRDIQKEAKDSGKVQPRSFFPATCTIPDSSRYTSSTKTKKPVPFNKHYVMVAGFLTDITSVLDTTDSKIKDRFCIEVGNVAFLGSQITPATGGSVKNSLTSMATPTPKQGWSYSAGGKGKKRLRDTSPERAQAGSPSGAGSSSPAPGPSSSPSPFQAVFPKHT